jgi:hypothetical protein
MDRAEEDWGEREIGKERMRERGAGRGANLAFAETTRFV